MSTILSAVAAWMTFHWVALLVVAEIAITIVLCGTAFLALHEALNERDRGVQDSDFRVDQMTEERRARLARWQRHRALRDGRGGDLAKPTAILLALAIVAWWVIR